MKKIHHFGNVFLTNGNNLLSSITFKTRLFAKLFKTFLFFILRHIILRVGKEKGAEKNRLSCLLGTLI